MPKIHPIYKNIIVCKNGTIKRSDKKKIGFKINTRYAWVYVSKVGWKKVNYLVLETYNRFRKLNKVCRHLNGKSLDNRLTNLKWGTLSENALDRVKHGKQNPPPIHTPELRKKLSDFHKKFHVNRKRNKKGRFI